MVFLNWKELPIYWYGFNHFAYAALMVVVLGVGPGGVLAIRVRLVSRFRRPGVTGVYLSIITPGP